MKVWIVFCLLHLLYIVTETKGPPRVLRKVTAPKYVWEGSSVKLECQVVAEPPVFLQWSKGHEAIHDGWERFRMRGNSLKIHKVEKADAGNYTCKATNGFGSCTINVTLVVFAKRNVTIYHGAHYSVIHKTKHKDGTPPIFVQPIKMVKKSFQRPVASSIHFKCRAHAKPRPYITWYKDGRRILHSTSKKIHWTLKLSDLKKEDSGHYMCKVANQYGYINYTYTLAVIDEIKQKKPVLLPPHPVNTTVLFGTTASFQCKVRSAVQPHIQWLKRVDNALELKNRNATIIVKGQKFIVLKSGSVWPRSDGSYINKLVIHRATLEHEGMYICLGANTMGYSFKSAYLKVIPPRNRNITAWRTNPRLRPPYTDKKLWKGKQTPTAETQTKKQSNNRPSLPLIIALPAVFIVIVVSVAIYFLQRKKKCNNPPEVCSNLKDKSLGVKNEKHKLTAQQYAQHHYQQHNPKINITENALCDKHYMENVVYEEVEDSMSSTRPSVHSVNPRSVSIACSSRSGSRHTAPVSSHEHYNSLASGLSRMSATDHQCSQWDVLAGYSDISSVSQTRKHHINHYDC